MVRFFLVFCLFSWSALAARYELRLTSQSPSAEVQLALRHPLQSDDQTNLYRSLDCGVLTPSPDWGVQGYEHDDPYLQTASIQGGKLITANNMLVPGNAGVIAYSVSGATTCSLEIVSWPGVASQIITGYVRQGGGAWFITNLPCATPLGFKIIKAKQKLRGGRWLWVKVKAEFDQPLLLNDVTNTFYSSIKNERWIMHDFGDHINVNRQLTAARFGRQNKAIIKSKRKQKIKLFGQALENYQNETIPIFININTYSGYQIITFDERGKYKAPKD